MGGSRFWLCVIGQDYVIYENDDDDDDFDDDWIEIIFVVVVYDSHRVHL